MIKVRFDDYLSKSAYGFINPVEVLETYDLESVKSIFNKVQDYIDHDEFYIAGFISYEAATAFDTSLQTQRSSSSIPLVWLTVFEQVENLEFLTKNTETPILNWELNITEEEYLESFNYVQNQITQGNTYQVNLTSLYKSNDITDSFVLYRDLVFEQRGSYNSYVDTDKFSIISVSPELFFSLKDKNLTTKPMKGTIQRGRTLREDTRNYNLLNNSAKDKSENLMIVDLIRNDLGRIAKYGTVKTPDTFSVQRLKTLWQMTSEITCELNSEMGLFEIFQALFPCGSVTGAPKASTMKIIKDTEPEGRGLYCGAIGYIVPKDSPMESRFSVAIRTVVLDKKTNSAYYGSGGAITFDSDMKSEFAELKAKSNILLPKNMPSGLFETMRFELSKGIIHLERHLKRLMYSLEYFGIDFKESAIRDSIDQYCCEMKETMRIRLDVDRYGKHKMNAQKFNDTDEVRKVILHDEPIYSNNIFNFHKVADRSLFENIKRHWQSYNDVILYNERGHVTQSLMANVVVLLNDNWVTPPIECGLLPGIYREVLLERGDIIEGIITVEDFFTAEAIALINSLRGWKRAARSTGN
jgi:para-aminobenzoate synthetase/4-amino-4-deoxychorismate lyase